MSKFYTEISKYYDAIFPIGMEQIDRIKELVGEPPKEILDAACGSGGYSKVLSDAGYAVTAIDLSEEMVGALKQKDSSIDARVMNLLEIGRLEKKFDLIFCIGNSLVHLDNDAEVLRFLEACRSVLNPGGRLLLQIINYDRVLAKNVNGLPTIRNEDVGLVFERHYAYLPKENKVDFKTILKVDGLELENHQLLHPIQSEDLLDLLSQSGFCQISRYANFKMDAFDPMTSVPLVVVAT